MNNHKHIPTPVEARAIIALEMERMPFGAISEERRDEIARGALGPVLFVIEALQIAAESGPDVDAVVRHYIGSLHAETELEKREQHFHDLITRLQARTPPGRLSS